MPRPVEIKFEVSLFMDGEDRLTLERCSTLAADFEGLLEGEFKGNFVLQQTEVLAVEVSQATVVPYPVSRLVPDGHPDDR